ncbi:hypothetical protein HF086_017644 [Spodoptera exigua]|uniref:Uncharacterized protein n=1 Tax=Spodoptera exigua TaxID=7107 RepID=A0A922ME56_SPOEX|nr:hypothetical protein HF086_017644 [Spodoptera exigua]
MDKNSSTDSNISLDSLETQFKRKKSVKGRMTDEDVDTILVPFYEKDVLIKVPKDQKRKQNNTGNRYLRANEKLKKEPSQTSYLVNREKETKHKRTTYLEMFRKQFSPNHIDKKKDKNEIRSLSPEFGDTERESIGDDANNPIPEFYNTESYNEMYYEKLLCRDLENYIDNSFEDQEEELRFTDDMVCKPEDICDDGPDNLKSVSEVTNPRRNTRRATIEPMTNVKLGGLGPDLEQIRPRLERARSLQRYSEKVRMENRLKIYKKTCQTQPEKKVERETSAKQKESRKEPAKKEQQEDVSLSYLVNKSINEKGNKPKRNPYFKSKSADVQRIRERNAEKEKLQKELTAKKKEMVDQKLDSKQKVETKPEKGKLKQKSSSRNMGINTESSSEVSPVQISFMVNVGGVRQSSALQSLEEKHRMYQEQVKAFMENNDV